MIYVLLGILGIILCLILVIIVRTIMFKPYKKETIIRDEVSLNNEKIVRDMVDMIKCKTVSNRDESLVDRQEFEKFERLMEERFPNIYKHCEFNKIGKTGLLYYLKGKSSDKPSVCMAHYDVVPVEEETWTKPAFDGLIEGDCIWGRGTLDTKGTLCGVVEALELLLQEGYVPENDLYLSFSGEEEIDGDSCADIVSYLENKGVKCVVDATGDLLLNVLKYKPFLVKPNKHELAEMFDTDIETEHDIIAYALKLKELGAMNVLVSMAGDGAVLIDETGQVHRSPAPEGKVVNSVGAGDSMVAGFIAGYLEKREYEHAFKMGIASGSASAFSKYLATKDEVLEVYGRVLV